MFIWTWTFYAKAQNIHKFCIRGKKFKFARLRSELGNGSIR
jgi:hypothetical protein